MLGGGKRLRYDRYGYLIRENRGMRILAASRDLREVFSFLRTTNREIVHAVPTPILQTVRPVLNRLNPSSQTGTSYQPRPPTETSPPGAAIVDLKEEDRLSPQPPHKTPKHNLQCTAAYRERKRAFAMPWIMDGQTMFVPMSQ